MKVTDVAICPRCGNPLSEGTHELSADAAIQYGYDFCPKCSGGPDDGLPHCVAAGLLYYRCSCGVTWSQPV